MRGDESAVAHVDQHHFERGDTGLARDRDAGERQRRPVGGLRQGPHLRLGDPQELIGVEYNDVGRPEIAQLFGVQRAFRHGRERDLLEVRPQEGKKIELAASGAASDFLRRPQSELLASASGR